MSVAQTDRFQIDMCHGPLFRQIILFSLPLVSTFILQTLFNAADLVVIGRYASHEAMASIGATLNMNALVLNVFIGLSIGSNVIASRFFGAKDDRGMSRTVHTAITLSFFGGIALAAVAQILVRPLLVLMGTPEDILPRSCLYIRICFAAIPFIMLYNFGCSILRAVGDTRRPLFFLVIAGSVNVLLNLVFVIVLHMDVAGVALATAVSHVIASVLILRTLTASRASYGFSFGKIGVDRAIVKEMMRIGIPAGIQSSCFAVSNMVIQSSVNSFGSLAIAGNTAALGLESILYVGSYSFHQAAISFTAQNLGGRKYKRILRSIFGCFLCASVATLVMGYGFYFAGAHALAVFNPDPEVIQWGMIRMKILFTTYALCGIMDVASGALRGLGYSTSSAVISLTGACGFRVFWVFVVFPHDRSMKNLMISYPISWLLVSAVSCLLLWYVYRRIIRGVIPARND